MIPLATIPTLPADMQAMARLLRRLSLRDALRMLGRTTEVRARVLDRCRKKDGQRCGPRWGRACRLHDIVQAIDRAYRKHDEAPPARPAHLHSRSCYLHLRQGLTTILTCGLVAGEPEPGPHQWADAAEFGCRVEPAQTEC